MNAAAHIRDLTACPRCKTASLRWEAVRIECTSCGQIFDKEREIPMLVVRDDVPRTAEADRRLLDRLPRPVRPLATRSRRFLRPLLTYRSRTTRSITPTFVRSFGAEQPILNVGAGETQYGANVVNLDIAPDPGIHVVGVAEALPFRDAVFEAVVFQAVLEHVRDATLALAEIRRVLRPGGAVLIEVPFIQGYHAAPGDYRRFTVSGLEVELTRNGFTVEDAGVAVGPASAMAWVTAEFLALLLSGRNASVYRVARIFTTWLAWPLKWSDSWLDRHQMAHVVASGVWARARRT